MRRDWSEIHPEFRRHVAQEGASKTAERMMVDRRTIYRLIKQETERPHPRTVEAAEKLLKNKDD